MLRYFRKADFFLLIFLVVAGIVGTIYFSFGREAGSQVVVKVDGEVYGTYSLASNQVIEVDQGDNTNIINIKDGVVEMESSTCKNQVCVAHAPITTTGETIVCLPNRVLVTIEGEGGGFDAVTK